MKSFDSNNIVVRPISNKNAKPIVLKNHYMATFPAGAKCSFGIYYGNSKIIKGVAVFGKSSTTDSKAKLFPGVEAKNLIEMQRFWISDELGKNAESKTLALIMKIFKEQCPEIKVIFTYAGGCKGDCGIVYQSSGFMYLGSEKCNDFYLTEKGEYKNIVNVLRFGKAPKELSKEEKARYVYGQGKLLETKRYFYFYPIEKKIRRKMKNAVLNFPKDSTLFRKDQEWVVKG